MSRLRRVLAAAATLTAALVIPAAAAQAATPGPDIPGGHSYSLDNFDFEGGVEAGWQASQFNGIYYALPPTGETTYITNGTWQTYVIENPSTLGDYGCGGLDHADGNILRFQLCNSRDWQEWASENTVHGWLIYNKWFGENYPNFCAGGYQAVVTMNAIGDVLALACPEGGVPGTPWGPGQFWAARTPGT